MELFIVYDLPPAIPHKPLRIKRRNVRLSAGGEDGGAKCTHNSSCACINNAYALLAFLSEASLHHNDT